MEEFIMGKKIVKTQGIISNGKHVRMVKDPWLPMPSSLRPICFNPSMYNSKVAYFLLPSGSWYIDFLEDFLRDDDALCIRNILVNIKLQDKFIGTITKLESTQLKLAISSS